MKACKDCRDKQALIDFYHEHICKLSRTHDYDGATLRTLARAKTNKKKPKPTPKPTLGLTEDDREKERCGDLDGMADMLGQIFDLPEEALTVVIRRFTDGLLIRSRTGARRATRQLSDIYSRELTTRGH